MVGMPTPSPTEILMMSLVESPDDEDEDELLVPPFAVPLSVVPLPLPLPLLMDGEGDDEADVVALVAVGVPSLLVDGTVEATDCVDVGAVSATAPTTIVVVAVTGGVSMFPAPSTWLQVSIMAAKAPEYRARQEN